MHRIAALDLGDRWVGVALSDPLGLTARPYETVEAHELIDFLKKIISSEQINTIVVGYPKTMRGTESEQTKKVLGTFDALKEQFPAITWIPWDERLTSKQAAQLSRGKKQEKTKEHAMAAALILSGYLESLAYRM